MFWQHSPGVRIAGSVYVVIDIQKKEQHATTCGHRSCFIGLNTTRLYRCDSGDKTERKYMEKSFLLLYFYCWLLTITWPCLSFLSRSATGCSDSFVPLFSLINWNFKIWVQTTSPGLSSITNTSATSSSFPPRRAHTFSYSYSSRGKLFHSRNKTEWNKKNCRPHKLLD